MILGLRSSSARLVRLFFGFTVRSMAGKWGLVEVLQVLLASRAVRPDYQEKQKRIPRDDLVEREKGCIQRVQRLGSEPKDPPLHLATPRYERVRPLHRRHEAHELRAIL